MRRLLVCLLVWAAVSAQSVQAKPGCSVAYGENWAFAFATPANWSSLCGAEELAGAPVALWPVGSTFAAASAVMYINAADKSEPSLRAFVQFSQALFREQAPDVIFSPATALLQAKVPMLQFQATGDPGGNTERIAYVEGPNAYFLLVLSARTKESLYTAEPAFIQLLQSFSPMSAKSAKKANPAIKRTTSGMPRLPPAAAHVER